MEILQAHAVNNLCYRTAQKMVPQGIVVHSTGANNPYLKRYVDCPEELGSNRYGNHWNTEKPGGRRVCVHAFIGYDKDKNIRVAEILPLDICCWGVGSGSKGSYNYNPPYIQFEICEDGLTDETYYRKAFAEAAEYCAYLCKKYELDVEKIVGHAEAHKLGYGNNHGDPDHWMKRFGETMADFRNQVCVLLKSAQTDKAGASQTVPEESTEKPSICEGDLVCLADDAVYYHGKSIPEWVKKQKWYVKKDPVGDRVIIDKNETDTNSICSPVHRKYLTVMKRKKDKENVV